MGWSNESSRAVLRNLDSIERVLVAFYRLLLGFIIVGVLAVVVFVIATRPWGGGNQGEWFYFSIGVLLVLGWAISQFIALGRRQRNFWPSVALTSDNPDGGQTWQFQFGRAAQPAQQNSGTDSGDLRFELLRSLLVPLASLPPSALPTEAAVQLLQTELDRGLPIEEACRLVQPAYSHWSEHQQQAYRLYVTTVLSRRHGE